MNEVVKAEMVWLYSKGSHTRMLYVIEGVQECCMLLRVKGGRPSVSHKSANRSHALISASGSLSDWT